MLGIVKRDEDEFNAWLKKQHAKAAQMLEGWGLDPTNLLSTELGWLMCVGKYESRELIFDLFQVGFLMNQERMRSMNKARQIGFSFGIACESLARCHLKDRHTAVCVSYNLDDAKEKIARVKELHEELPLEYQKTIHTDSKTEVSFLSHSSKRRISKVISYPSKAPRGKTGDVYLDEIAHCQNDRAIYQGATALISRSGGQLTMGSTPLGQRGVFHAVHTQAFDRYPGFSRFNVAWWRCRHFSKISSNLDKIALCETLPTEVRVERYGTQAIKDQFNALPIEDFQQEFELAFQDERVSFFPYDMILPCAAKEAYEIPVYDNLEQLADVAPKLGPLYIGLDIGRVKHPSELSIFEKVGNEFVARYFEQWRDMPFPKQRARAKQIGRILGDNWKKWRIDSTGLGKNLAEDLQLTFGSRRVIQFDFSMKSKENLANNVKILLQERAITLPKNRGIIAQIHSIKQKITPTGNAIYDAERNRRHHADKFWAIALACYQARKRRRAEGRVSIRTAEPKEARPEEEVKPEGILHQAFAVKEPDPSEIEAAKAARVRAALRAASDHDLQEKSAVIASAMRTWHHSGDEEKVKELAARYKRVRREIKRREAIDRALQTATDQELAERSATIESAMDTWSRCGASKRVHDLSISLERIRQEIQSRGTAAQDETVESCGTATPSHS